MLKKICKILAENNDSLYHGHCVIKVALKSLIIKRNHNVIFFIYTEFSNITKIILKTLIF